MLVVIPEILNTEQLHEAQKLLAGAPFIDGKLSAGAAAKRVKHNEEMSHNAAQLQRLNNLIMGALVPHPQFQNAALPHRIAMPIYAKYSNSHSYGDHIDDPVMGPAGQRYRSDVSTTVFLNSPDDYAGGELVIRTSFGETRVKPAAGSAVVYPSSTLHRVTAVTHGQRLVAVTWIQSLVRDPAKRELLYELNSVREPLLLSDPDNENTKKIDRTYVNLIRMWSEV